MKKLLNYIFLLSLLLCSACSKDFGNYDYSKVNDISIVEGVLAGDRVEHRIYRVIYEKELKIMPVVTGTLSGSDVSQLAFAWYIDGELVSEEQNLVFKADKKIGQVVGNLKILDKSSSISKSYNFFVDIINSFKLGYYILSENANQDAMLYTISSVDETPIVERLNVPSFNNLGKNPIYLGGYHVESVSDFRDYWNVIFLGVKDAKYPVMLIDSRRFLPFRLYNSSSYIGDGDFEFSPSQIWSDLESNNDHVYANNKGKLHLLTRGVISEVKYPNDPWNYSMASNGLFRPSLYLSADYYSSRYTAFYDNLNKTVRMLSNKDGRLFSFNESHDDAIDASLLDGHEFLFGSNYLYGEKVVMFTFITRKDNRLHCFEVGIDEYGPSQMKELGSIDILSYAPITKILFNESRRQFQIAMGKTIYTMDAMASNHELELREYVTLPADAKGNISDFSTGSMHDSNYNPNLLLISTFDQSFSGDKKSSIYIYNRYTQELFYSYENCVEQVKGLYVGV